MSTTSSGQARYFDLFLWDSNLCVSLIVVGMLGPRYDFVTGWSRMAYLALPKEKSARPNP